MSDRDRILDAPASPDDAVVSVEGLRKRRGDRDVLVDVDFAMRRGHVFGLVGPNGAGKTTTIKVLLGLLRPDAGTVRVFGTDPMELSIAHRQRIGYLSEEPEYAHWDLPIAGQLEYHSQFFAEWDWSWCRGLLDRLGVPEDRPFGSLSKGERRKAELAVALAHRPDLLVLDDPALGLDATARREILWATLDAAREEGTTVLFTSHILQDVERVVDDVLILDRGRVRARGSLDELKARTKRLVFRGCDGREPPEVPGRLQEQSVGKDRVVVTGRFSPELPAALRGDGADVEVEDLNLEEMFCAYVDRQKEAGR